MTLADALLALLLGIALLCAVGVGVLGVILTFELSVDHPRAARVIGGIVVIGAAWLIGAMLLGTLR